MKKRKFFIILFIVLAVVAGGAYFARSKLSQSSKKEEVFYTVRQERSENIIEISGNISAANEQTMQASGSGTVKKIYVKEGDTVKEGQLVIELDSISEEYSLAKQDYDIQQKRINGARKEVELMQKQRELLYEKLEDRKVYARFDGVAAQIKVDEGDVVVAQDALGTLLDRSYLTATVEVVETDAGKLKIGQQVEFKFPAYPDKKIIGHVVAYPAVSRITSRGATVVDAEVRIEDPPAEILTGYSFTGKIEISAPEDVLLVERYAIGYDQGKSFAEVVSGETTNRVSVEVVAYDSLFVRVKSGLNAGDVLKAQSEAGRGIGGGAGGPGGPGGPPRGGR